MVLDFGMDKKWIIAFATIAIVVLSFEMGVVVNAMGSSVDGEYEMGFYYDKLLVYKINPEVGPPAWNEGIYYYEMPLGIKFAGLDLNVAFIGTHCIVEYAFSYIRDPWIAGRVRITEGDVSTLVKYDDLSFIVHVPENVTNGNPWVFMVGVTPMGWNGVHPASSVVADISEIQVIGG